MGCSVSVGFQKHATAAATLLGEFAFTAIGQFAVGKVDEDGPEVLGVIEAREAALLNGFAGVLEDDRGEVFLILGGGETSRGFEFLTSQTHEGVEIALPEKLDRLRIALFELGQPMRDRTVGEVGHGGVILRAAINVGEMGING